MLQARSISATVAEFLIERLDLETPDPFGDGKPPSLAKVLRAARHDLSMTLPLPVALGGLKKGSRVVDILEEVREMGVGVEDGDWIYYYPRSFIVLSRLSDRTNQEQMTQLLDNL